MATTILLRRGTSTEWTDANPILGVGEAGVETDTGRVKFGNGTVHWVSLPYVDATAVGDLTAALAAETARAEAAEASAQAAAEAASIPLTQKGAASGVATLDSGGKLTAGQIPSLAIGEVSTVASQAAMLALTAERGDVAIRTDLDPDGVFILTTDDPTQLANWVQITAPGAVISVAGRVGAVTLDAADVTDFATAVEGVGDPRYVTTLEVPTDGVTDAASTIQAAYDAGMRTLRLAGGVGATVLLDTPVFFDANINPEIVTIDLQGGTLKLGSGLPRVSAFYRDFSTVWGFFPNTVRSAVVTPSTATAWTASTGFDKGDIVTDGANHLFVCTLGGLTGGSPPAWNTAAGATTTDGGVEWTSMGTGGTAVPCGYSTLQQNAATGATLPAYPNLVIRNGILDGGTQNAGFVFGNGATAGFEHVIFQNFKYGLSWVGFADGAWFEHVTGRLAVTAGLESIYPWLCSQVAAGDGLRFDHVKCNTNIGIHKAFSCHGATASSIVSGAFDYSNSDSIVIDGWHNEMDQQGKTLTGLTLDGSTVTVRGAHFQAPYQAGTYFVNINDGTPISQSSQLILEDCSPSVSMRTQYFPDVTRSPDIYITAMNDDGRVIVRKCRGQIYDPLGTAAFSDSLIIGSAVSAITAALTNTTYGSQMAVTADDFMLHKAGGAWVVRHDSVFGDIRYQAQATPTSLTLISAFSKLPTISSITTDGTKWTIVFSDYHGLKVGYGVVLDGFTPSGYNKTLSVATIVNSTTVTALDATQPGAITVTGTSCTSSNKGGTLASGTSYNYTVATIDDDGLLSAACAAVAFTADVTGCIRIAVNVSAPFTGVVIWRKAAAGVLTAPDVYQIVPVNKTVLRLFDTGANINGRAWINTSVPIPNTSFLTTTSTMVRTERECTFQQTGDLTKTTDTALADLPGLASPVKANSTYVFEGVLIYKAEQNGTGSSGEAQLGLTGPSGFHYAIAPVGLATSATSSSGSLNALAVFADSSPAAAQLGGAGTGVPIVAAVRIIVVTASTAGTVQFQGAQKNSSSGSTVFLGSTHGVRSYLTRKLLVA